MAESSPQIAVSRTSPEKLSDLVVLLRERDERQHPADAVSKYLFDLDPEKLVAWTAKVDQKTVGLNSVYIRNLKVAGQTHKTGYWAHLFIEPDYRKHMLYPRLVAAMLKDSGSLGQDFVYTATRREHVAESHRKLGFVQVGTMSVLAKPLRPGRLIVKHKYLPAWMAVVLSPADMLWDKFAKLRQTKPPFEVEIREISWEQSAIEPVVELLNTECGESISQAWDVDHFIRRFQSTIEGWSYTLYGAYHDGQLLAAILYRVAERGEHVIRLGVLMDVLGSETHPEATKALLSHVERQAVSESCEAMVLLDGAGAQISEILKSSGYRNTSETYFLLVGPKLKMSNLTGWDDLANWRFTFADHDAF